ncbi:MAG: exo-alpha-sialidase [Opitutae bacterium]|nr:exo-alpha-sialidase [Opitutae bacterium]
MRILTCLLLLVLAGCTRRAAEPLTISSPAGAGALGASFATAADGAIFLSWLEPAHDKTWALKLARFDAAGQRWQAPVVIAQGPDWFVNWADFPTVTALERDRLIAVWFVHEPDNEMVYHAEFSTSADGGATWAAPQKISAESARTEFTAIHPLGPTGRPLAAWLDGRERAAGRDHQTLHARVLAEAGPDVPVDGFVCDCCQLSFAPLPDGGALLAYRGRTTDEVRDIRLVRYRNGQWEKPRPLHADGWKINACPVNGPRLASRGSAVTAVWFTGADNQPRVQAKHSTDGGETFGEPLRLDLGRPQGRVDCLILANGTSVLTWLERANPETGVVGGIYLRTLSGSGQLSAPRLLAASSPARASGFPRLAALDGRRLLLAYTQDSDPSQVITQVIPLD